MALQTVPIPSLSPELLRDILGDRRIQLLEDEGETVRDGGVVILHDPQTAGLALPLMAAGARVAWRCHVGSAEANGATERAWEFLRRYLTGVPTVISRTAYLPSWVDQRISVEIAPSI